MRRSVCSRVVASTLVFVSVTARADDAPKVQLAGWVEAYGQWNLNAPSNGITHLRGFDNRHASFTLSNAVLDAGWDASNVTGRVSLQFGSTPATYYLAEPALPGAAGTNGSDAKLWRFVQQAYAGVRAPLLEGLLVQGGLFLSPIGIEAMAVKDNWNFSRSNLFVGLPFYHSGVRATLSVDAQWSVTAAVFNGWNSVVDNNVEKSVLAQVSWSKPGAMAFSALYFGGVERSPGAVEGRAWRHLVDAWFTIDPAPGLSLTAHVNAGAEPNALGFSGWLATAGYARVQVRPELAVAVRADWFRELVAPGAAAIFWPVPWMASGTVTLDYRPFGNASLRLEYRHDRAGGEAFFGGDVDGTGDPDDPFLPNREVQDTVTLGLVAWF